jgi:hypothetical protein
MEERGGDKSREIEELVPRIGRGVKLERWV